MSRLWKKTVWFYKKRGLTALVRKILCKSLQKFTAFVVNHTVYARWYISGRSKMFAEMKNDPSFTVSDNLLRSILSMPLKKYEVSYVKVSSLKRIWEGQIMPLSETATYAYIINGDKERYVQYVRTVNEYAGVTDEKILANIVANDLGRLQRTTASLMNEGYDVRRAAVIVEDRNVIMDGIHRSCILCKKFGPDYEFPVLRIYRSRPFW